MSTATASGIQIQRIALLQALRSVADALPSGPTVNPADKAVLLQAAGDTFHLYANNREAWVRLRVDGWEGDELHCLIDHAKISALLSGIGAAHVDLSVETGGLRVRWGQSGFSLLPLFDVDLYVSAPSPENETEMFRVEDAGALATAIRAVGYAGAPANEPQYRVLQSVHLASEDGSLAAWGASSVKQAYKRVAAPFQSETGITLPTNAAKAVAAFLEVKDGQPVSMHGAEGARSGYMRFTVGDSEILALLAANDDVYPIAVPRALFASETYGEVFVDRKSLLRTIALVKQTAPQNGRISLHVADGEIILKSQDPYVGGEMTERVPADVLHGMPDRKDFNYAILSEVLGKMDGEEVRLRFIVGKTGLIADHPNDPTTAHACAGFIIPD
jgi:DNA polymerase III sliding clamp (beta) subunit (PCNA family)